MAIFPIGIPLTFVVLLWRSQRGRKPDDTDTSPYDFLRKDYRHDAYFYEVIVLIEKLLLTGVLIFIDQGSVFQPSVDWSSRLRSSRSSAACGLT